VVMTDGQGEVIKYLRHNVEINNIHQDDGEQGGRGEEED